MNKTKLITSELKSAPIGFGCASLGSRISARAGFAAMAKAHDAGIDWFDVAPAYGAGEAEVLLGQFAKGRRSQMIICSKVGLAPPNHSNLLRFVYTFARPLVGLAKGVRRRVRNAQITTNNRLELTPCLIRESLERSLRRLGTDYLDVFALHDPMPDDVRRDDIYAELENLIFAGKVRFISCAGSFEAAKTALSLAVPLSFIQFSDPPGGLSRLTQLRSQFGDTFNAVTHSVLGVGGAAERLAQSISGNSALAHRLANGGNPRKHLDIAANLLLRRAFTQNERGIVLLSLFSQGHLEAAVSAAQLPLLTPEVLTQIDLACANTNTL